MLQSEFSSKLMGLMLFTAIQFSLSTSDCVRLLLRLKCIASFPTLRVSSPFCTSIRVAPIAKKGLPNNRGTYVSSSILMTTKSTGKMNFPTLISTSSRTPSGCAIDLSAICSEIVVGVSSPKLNLCTNDKGLKLMLAPKSYKAFLNSYFPIVQGMVKLLGYFILVGRLF